MRCRGIEELRPVPELAGRLPPLDPVSVALAAQQGIEVLPPVAIRAGSLPGEIVLGLMTWRVAQQIGVHDVPVVELELGAEEGRALALQDASGGEANPVGLARLLNAMLKADASLSKAELGRRVGVGRTEVSHLIRLLSLDDVVLGLLVSGQIKQGHARPLIGLPRHKQISLARQAALQRLSVGQVRELVKKGGGAPTASEPAPVLKTVAPVPEAVRPVYIEALERELSELLGSPVTISPETAERGVLKIPYHTLEILEGIMEKFGRRREE